MQPVKVTVTNTNANQSQYDYVSLQRLRRYHYCFQRLRWKRLIGQHRYRQQRQAHHAIFSS